jgi:molybdate transport system ATP-binding protein
MLNEEQIEKVKTCMNILHIGALENQLLFNLPLGKQRLILLARALVKNPPLLLLDEPGQGLDEEQTNLLKNSIEEICEYSDKTLIYVTHLQEEIPSCVTKFLRLEKGKRVE